MAIEYKCFICHGYCFWRMPSQEEINLDLSLQFPPESITSFIGTDFEAYQAGWRLAPKSSEFVYNDENIYLCPKCFAKVIG